jgi:hypothetical protein
MSIAIPRRRMQAHHAAFLLLIALLAGRSASAAGTVLATSFEPPYPLGALENVPGWVSAPSSGASSAIVQNTVAHTGSQAVLVTRSANSDRRWAVPQVNLPSQRFIAVDWDMRVSPSSASGGFGPFLGVETYDANNGINVLGSLGVDASTRDVLYQIQDTAELTESGFEVAYNEWYHYRILLDFQTDSYRAYVNDNLVATTGFADRGFGLNDFTDADISAIAAGFDEISQGLSASAVIDNFVIRDGLVGDYDIDGNVDVDDRIRWRTVFGSSIAPPGNGADGNRNGVVDAADYVLWRKNVGASLFPGSGLGASVVPEPMGLLLGAIAFHGLAAILARRR